MIFLEFLGYFFPTNNVVVPVSDNEAARLEIRATNQKARVRQCAPYGKEIARCPDQQQSHLPHAVVNG